MREKEGLPMKKMNSAELRAYRLRSVKAYLRLRELRKPKVSAPKGELSRLVESLLMDGSLTYRDILEAVKAEFPDANTTNKSIASVASVMRRKGHDVPKRVMY
jgi:hypothetical protein